MSKLLNELGVVDVMWLKNQLGWMESERVDEKGE